MTDTQTRSYQGKLAEAIALIEKQHEAPEWVVRSIRARIPDIARYTANRLIASQSAEGAELRSGAIKELGSEQAHRFLVEYARSIALLAARQGKKPTLQLMYSNAWIKSLPCCSKFPFWPACRRGC